VGTGVGGCEGHGSHGIDESQPRVVPLMMYVTGYLGIHSRCFSRMLFGRCLIRYLCLCYLLPLACALQLGCCVVHASHLSRNLERAAFAQISIWFLFASLVSGRGFVAFSRLLKGVVCRGPTSRRGSWLSGCWPCGRPCWLFSPCFAFFLSSSGFCSQTHTTIFTAQAAVPVIPSSNSLQQTGRANRLRQVGCFRAFAMRVASDLQASALSLFRH